MSRLVNINLKLKDGRSIVVSVDEDKVDRFRNGPDKLLDALAKKYPHDLPTKPVYISVQNNQSGSLIDGENSEINFEDIHNMSVITLKERRGQHGSFYWERNDVLTLIRVRSEKEPIFNKFGIRKKDVWAMIAEEFQTNGLDVTSGQCEQKWKNITKSYRDTVDYNYFSNTHRECPFFKELAAIYPYDPKEKHSNQQSEMNMPGGAVGSVGRTNDNTADTTVNSSEEFPNYPGIDTAGNSSGRPPENLAVNIQQDTYLQEVTSDISVEALFEAPEIKQEILDDDDDDDPIIVIPPSPPQPQPPLFTASPAEMIAPKSSVSSLSSNRASSNFQHHSLPQIIYTSSECNAPSSSSIYLSSLSSTSSSSLPAPLAESVVKQESISVPISQQYSYSNSDICLQPQIAQGLQTPQMSITSLHPQPSYSSNQPHEPPINHNSQTRKRPRENLAFTTPSSGSSVSDMLTYRRRLLQRTPFSMPNNVTDMLKQMNEERRREHRTLVSTLNQHHEDLLDLFKQNHQDYLHQEEIKQALLSELIERVSKH